MKRLILMAAFLAISLPLIGCKITVVNDLGQPIILIDGVQGDVDRLPLLNPNVIGNAKPEQIYQSNEFQKITVAPNESATIGHPHVHAHFLLATTQPKQWYELSQFQCTGRTHETLQASEIVNNQFGPLSNHFGSLKLSN